MTNALEINNQREFAFDDIHFRFLAGLANQKTGIVLAEHKRDMVYGRLVRRLRALNLEGFAEYCELLQSEAGKEELPHLVNAITTNLTGFFREAHHFDHLAEQAKTWNQSGTKKLRIWSAGCSSGMEPYSIAMTLKNVIPDIEKWDAKILATDIDSNMLNKGIVGEYNLSDLDKTPAACKALTSVTGSKVRMNQELKNLISFKQLNLLDAWPMKGPFDAIFCRNVVIYFDKPTKQVLFERMAEMLKPGSYLYIGHSENMHGICDRFELLGRTIYRRVK